MFRNECKIQHKAKRGLSCKNIINLLCNCEVTVRKNAKEGQVSQSSPQERRVNTWFTHFKNLIGNHPSTDENKDIPAIFSDLDINDGLFTHSEFVKIKRSLKEEVALMAFH